ncbi:MAG: SGNH/GDSL hydrolase family protein, partial [Armatimonadetes bacterium]|nr:SGNH/GDSL hydrolase family protein [Armatimonadota bacterium]
DLCKANTIGGATTPIATLSGPSGPIAATTVSFVSQTNDWGLRVRPFASIDQSATTLTISRIINGGAHIDGMIHYRGDGFSGIRVENVATSGIRLFDHDNTGDGLVTLDPQRTDLNEAVAIDQWTSAPANDFVTQGARRGGLVFLSLLTNDQGHYGMNSQTIQESKDIYKGHLEEVVARILARPSHPSVILLSHPAPDGREANYRFMKQAMREVADANSDVAICDMDAAYRFVPYQSLPATIKRNDGLHFTEAYHKALGENIAVALRQGYLRWRSLQP